MRYIQKLFEIICIILGVVCSKDIRIYPKLGFLTESTDSVVLVNGLAHGDISLRLNLPKIEINDNDETCAASKTENFSKILKSSVTKFQAEMSAELADILGEDLVPKNTTYEKLGPTKINEESIKKNPNLCNEEGVRCEWFPLVENDPTNVNHHTLVPCYDSSLGLLPSKAACKSEEGVGMCCSRTASKNVGKCPNDLTRAIHAVEIYLADFPRKTYLMGHGNVTMKNVHNYCFSLLNAHFNRKRIYQGTHNRGSPDRFLPRQPRETIHINDIGHDLDNYNKSKVLNSRGKRSNWSYLTSGWIFSSSYIDDKVQNVIDLEKADSDALKNALKANSNSLLKIQADIEEHKSLESNICSVVGALSEETFLNHLRNSQFKLESKAETLLRTCTLGRVPDYIGIHHLQKMCSAVSDSSTCSNSNLRDLFQCSVTRPQITLDYVNVNIKLIFRIPVSEDYEAFRVYSTGVPYMSSAIDSEFNITENVARDEIESETNNGNKEKVKMALAEILKDALTESRPKRELERTFHFLSLRHIPEIMIRHENDILLFYKRECVDLGRVGDISCDYGVVTTQHTRCVEGILDENISKIEHFCTISLFSSSSECILKPIGTLGYLVSSHNKIPITNSKDSRVFRNKNNIHECQRVCFIGMSEQDKFFSCGMRDFSLRSEKMIEIDFEKVDIKQTDLSSLKVRHHEIGDLEVSGFDTLDKKLNKQAFTKIKTISALFTTFSILVLGVIAFLCMARKIRNLIYNCFGKCLFKNRYQMVPGKNRSNSGSGMDFQPSGAY